MLHLIKTNKNTTFPKLILNNNKKQLWKELQALGYITALKMY